MISNADINKKLVLRRNYCRGNENGPLMYLIRDRFKIDNKLSAIKSTWKKYLKKPNYQPIDFYIHVPYCVKRCSYCVCNSKVAKKGDVDNYINNTIVYLSNFKNIFKKTVFRNLYIGGGTPNYLRNSELERLFAYIFNNFNFDTDGGRCIEMHPSLISESKLVILKKNKFNRINIGIQSLDPEVLKINNRGDQTEYIVKNAISMAKRVGFEYINVDLIIGLAGDTKEKIIKTFSKVLAMQPQKISLYPIYPKNEYYQNYFHSSKKEFDTFFNQLFQESMGEITSLVKKAGYEIPDTSNVYIEKFHSICFGYSKNGTKEHKEYIADEPMVSVFGIGEGSDSKIWNMFEYSTISLNKNINQSKFIGRTLNDRTDMVHFITTTLADKYSLSLSIFKKLFRVDLVKTFELELEMLTKLGVIKKDKNYIHLTTKDKKLRLLYLTFFLPDKEIKKDLKNNMNGNNNSISKNNVKRRNSHSIT